MCRSLMYLALALALNATAARAESPPFALVWGANDGIHQYFQGKTDRLLALPSRPQLLVASSTGALAFVVDDTVWVVSKGASGPTKLVRKPRKGRATVIWMLEFRGPKLGIGLGAPDMETGSMGPEPTDLTWLDVKLPKDAVGNAFVGKEVSPRTCAPSAPSGRFSWSQGEIQEEGEQRTVVWRITRDGTRTPVTTTNESIRSACWMAGDVLVVTYTHDSWEEELEEVLPAEMTDIVPSGALSSPDGVTWKAGPTVFQADGSFVTLPDADPIWLPK